MYAFAIILVELAIVALAGFGSLVLIIAVLAGATFVASGFIDGARHQGRHPRLGERLLLWCGEVLAAWSVFLLWMPFERWLMPRDCVSSRSASPPVLLIHGYVNNAGAMWRLWRALRADGWGTYTLNLEPVYTDIDAYAPLIAARIDAIRASTGCPEVVLVCHSMGGLAARSYLRHCSIVQRESYVAKVVTLGSPHSGTVLARIERSANGRQMVPGNPWLLALGAAESGAWSCPLVSIYSLDDNVVTPARSAVLEGARNIEISGVGHISLPLSSQVIRLVRSELRQERTHA